MIEHTPDKPEISVVMPCLNEADTLRTCLRKAAQALKDNQITGELVVADNGSTDSSQAIAAAEGARVVNVSDRGYGNALMGGIGAARGKFIIMGDADDSYDFSEIPKFVGKLREGFDLVQGCRLPSGGGIIRPGAMPFTHRWIGNPMFSFLVRHWFHAPIHDVYCGMRGFQKDLFEKLDQRCTGMEFATEMIIKSSLQGFKIAEVPITLHPDGRVSHHAHLRTVRDGWRTLRFYLLLCPRWLFLYPGLLLILAGLVTYAIALPGLKIGRFHFDVHSLLFGSLAILMGYQSAVFSYFARTFAMTEKLLPEDPRLVRFFKVMTLEKGLFLGCVVFLTGLALLGDALNQWRLAGFGDLDYSRTMRWVIPGVTLSALGFQIILSSFFASILGLARR